MDHAKGGYYTVEELPPGGRWKWRVTGYTAIGHKLLQTQHITDGSKDIECLVWESRGARLRTS